ncbi:uncharacterized protein CDAR_479351 [Caerostris darwini]|uniref:F-box domain-containing protein n=1 Tax=Caerostris darwini TaxID=1538125 RepID=A0AAV4MT28_9ARAC|nr:uncharacterized protein CDAR_479351 [Caerostris darwini]
MISTPIKRDFPIYSTPSKSSNADSGYFRSRSTIKSSLRKVVNTESPSKEILAFRKTSTDFKDASRLGILNAINPNVSLIEQFNSKKIVKKLDFNDESSGYGSFCTPSKDNSGIDEKQSPCPLSTSSMRNSESGELSFIKQLKYPAQHNDKNYIPSPNKNNQFSYVNRNVSKDSANKYKNQCEKSVAKVNLDFLFVKGFSHKNRNVTSPECSKEDIKVYRSFVPTLSPSRIGLFSAKKPKQSFQQHDEIKSSASLKNNLFSTPVDGVYFKAANAYTKTFVRHKKIDFFHELQKIGLTPIITSIFSFMSTKDLCAIACVTKEWREILLNDFKANSRRRKYLKNQERKKENLCYKTNFSKAKKKHPLHLLGGHALENQRNIIVEPKQPAIKQMDKKFDSFIQEGKKIKNGVLKKCPRCQHASKCTDGIMYVCSNCIYAFCKKCLSPYVTEKHFCPTSETYIPTIIGSKQSRKNLKRL